MKQENVSRMNRLLEETEAFLNERGATLLNGDIFISGNDYDTASALITIEITRPEKPC